MLFELLLGVLFGMFTGLTPGIHVNNVLFLFFLYPFIIPIRSIDGILVFVVSMATTHTFLDTIPSTFLGVPDAGTVLSILPAHRYMLEGRGIEAVKLTIIGSLGVLIIGVVLFPLWRLLALKTYTFIQPYIPIILFSVVLLTIASTKDKILNISITIAASLLGYLSMSFSDALIPLLSGMFGLSSIITSLLSKTVFPPQKNTSPLLPIRTKWMSIFIAQFAGYLTALLPGLGAGYAAAIGSLFVNGADSFLIMQGGVTTSNFIMSLATLASVGKARNGAILALTKLFPISSSFSNTIVLLLGVSLSAGALSALLALMILRIIPYIRINYTFLSIMILVWILIMNLFFCRSIALFGILLSSTGLGVITNLLGGRRALLLSSIMIPVAFLLL